MEGGEQLHFTRCLSPLPPLFELRAFYLCVSQTNTSGHFLSQGGGGRRIHFYVLDFKAIGAQEEFTKMSVSVIREEESENTEACSRSTSPSVEARPARRAQKNNEPASNLLNSSLIWDNSWCPWHTVCTTGAYNHSQNPNFSCSTWCWREKENQNKLWPLSHPQCCSCYSVSILQMTAFYNLLLLSQYNNMITFYLAA